MSEIRPTFPYYANRALKSQTTSRIFQEESLMNLSIASSKRMMTAEAAAVARPMSMTGLRILR